MTEPAPTRKHGLANAVIFVFLALQLAGPLSYYAGPDRFDERFAWRMFSPIRIAQCSARLYDATGGSEHEIALSRQIHMVWINLLKRARMRVLDRFAEVWCAEAPGRVLHADLTCVPPEAVRHPICRSVVDRDRDGVPDGFAKHEACGQEAPAACFARMCAGAAPNDCYAAHCQARLVPRDRDLCGGGA